MLQNSPYLRKFASSLDSLALCIVGISILFWTQTLRVMEMLYIPNDFGFLLNNPLFAFTTVQDIPHLLTYYYNPSYSIVPFSVYKALHVLGILNGHAVVLCHTLILALSAFALYLLVRHLLDGKPKLYAFLVASWLFFNPFSLMLLFKSNSMGILLALLFLQVLLLTALKLGVSKDRKQQLRLSILGFCVILFGLNTHYICSTFLLVVIFFSRLQAPRPTPMITWSTASVILVSGVISAYTCCAYFVFRSSQIHFFDLYPLSQRLLLYCYSVSYYFFNVLFAFNMEGNAPYPFYLDEEIPFKLFIYPATLIVLVVFFVQHRLRTELVCFFSLFVLLFIWGLDLLPIQNDYVVQLEYHPFYVTILICVVGLGLANSTAAKSVAVELP